MTAAGALLLGSGLARLSARDLHNSSRRVDMKNKAASMGCVRMVWPFNGSVVQ